MNPIKAFVSSGWQAAKHAAVKSVLTLASAEGWGGWGLSLLGFLSPTYARLAKLALESPYAGRALRMIADAAADLPIVVMRRDGEEEQAVRDDPALATIRRHWSELADATVWGLFCGGRLYVEKLVPTGGDNAMSIASPAAELRTWRADELRHVDRDASGDPLVYHFKGYKGATVKVEAARVLPLRTYDPKAVRGEESGQAILVSASRALQSLEASDVWNRSLAKSGGRLEGFMSPEGERVPTGDQTKRAQEILDERLNETRQNPKSSNWHVLNGAYKPVPLTMTPKDADFLKAALKDMEAVACVTGVPTQLLAHPKAGSLTDAGVDSEVRALLLLTVLPFVRRRVLDPLSAWLGEGARLDVDEAKVKALQEDEDARFKRYGEAYHTHRVMSLEEARERLDLPAQVDPAHTFASPADAVAVGVSADTSPGNPDDEPEADPPEGETAKSLGSLSVDAFGQLLELIPKTA